MCGRKGVSLVEILIGLIIVVVASIATLTYFSSALGGVGRQSNRRAALERARERLEQLLQVDPDSIKPTIDSALPPNGQPVLWVSCAGATCSKEISNPNETIDVEDLQGPQAPRLESTVQWKDDPAAGTTDVPDVLELGVKVWFFPNSTVDDDFHRVHLRTLRTP